MPYLLDVPTYRKQIDRHDRLWRWFTLDTAQSLVKRSGLWTLITSPSDDLLAVADDFYIGGYEYIVNDVVGAELIAAGFGDYLTEFDELYDEDGAYDDGGYFYG